MNEQNMSQPEGNGSSNSKHHPWAMIVLVIVSIILLTIVGFLSVLLSREDRTISNTQEITSAQELEQKDQEEVVEEDASFDAVAEFSNEEVVFEYPASWGEAVAENGPETDHLIAGSEKLITFSQNPNVRAGYQTTDWEHDPELGHDGLLYPGFLDFSGTVTDYKSYIDSTNVFIEEEGLYGFTSICFEFCSPDHPRTVTQILVDLNSDSTAGVEFQVYGDVLGTEYKDKEQGWNSEKIDEADVSELFPATDFRNVLLEQTARSVSAR